jgi:uncharacterized protein
MEDLLTTLADELVDDPGRVVVRSRERDGVLELTLDVAPEDRGRVIGQRGRTVQALRTFLEAVAERQGRKVALEIR